MRIVFEGEVVAEAATTDSPVLRVKGQREAWKLWDVILRTFNSGTGTCDVQLVSSITGEVIDTAAPAAGAGKSGNKVGCPDPFIVRITNVGVGGVVINAALDGIA